MVVRVIKKPKLPADRMKDTYTLRLSNDLMDRLQKLAKEHAISRTKLVEQMLRQALDDKNFTVEIT